MKFGIAILAAGSSSRMGRMKQLLPWRGTSLIRSVVGIALESRLGPVAVILGAQANLIGAEIRNDPVKIIHNPAHDRGPGTSVRAATHWAMDREFGGLVLLLADQPFVTAADLRRLATCALEGAAIAGSRYEDGPGVPALFTRRFFLQLLGIPDHQGAKTLLRSQTDPVAVVPIAHALSDLDSFADYETAVRSDAVRLDRADPDRPA